VGGRTLKRNRFARLTGPRLAAVVITAFALAAVGCSSSSSSSSGTSAAAASQQKPATVTIAFGLPLGNSSNPFAWIGKDLGFFAQNNVAPVLLGGVQEPDALLIAGKIDLSINGDETTLLDAAAGKPVQTHSVYNVQNRSQYEGVVLPTSSITQLTQLKGTKIGIPALDGTTEHYVTRVLQSGGLQNADVKFVATGIGAPMGQALKSGEVDAVFATRGQLGTLQSANYPLRFLPRPPFANQFITGNITARKNISAAQLQAIKGYLRAYTESIVFAKANPRAAMLINWHMYPQSVPKNVPLNTALNQALQVFQAYLSYIGPSDGQYGFMPPAEMQSYATYLGVANQVNVTDWYTNSLVAYANDFDHQAIIKMAENYKAPTP
jgi:ABC-type nitrate/sulfonate/bicarbonate transport system substrate-binding protein